MKTFGRMVANTAGAEEGDSAADENDLDRFARNSEGFEWAWNTHVVLVETAEAETMTIEMDRSGTKAMALYRGMWMGETVGTTASDIARRTFMPPHSYRLSAVLGAQMDPAALGPLLDGGRLGNPQRFLPLPVGVTVARGTPRLAITMPYVDYSGGQPVAAWLVEMLEGQNRPAFIRWCPAARAEFEAARAARTGSTFAAWDVDQILARAEIDDPIADMRGHELLHQMKIAAVMARADGLIDPTDAYWHAAGAVMQVRAAVMKATVLVLEAWREVERVKTGRDFGRTRAHGKIAQDVAEDQYRLDVAGKAAAAVEAAGKPISEGKIGENMGKTQQAVLPDVLSWMVNAKLLVEAGLNQRKKKLYALPDPESENATVPVPPRIHSVPAA
jgi:hypothetical protein